MNTWDLDYEEHGDRRKRNAYNPKGYMICTHNLELAAYGRLLTTYDVYNIELTNERLMEQRHALSVHLIQDNAQGLLRKPFSFWPVLLSESEARAYLIGMAGDRSNNLVIRSGWGERATTTLEKFIARDIDPYHAPSLDGQLLLACSLDYVLKNNKRVDKSRSNKSNVVAHARCKIMVISGLTLLVHARIESDERFYFVTTQARNEPWMMLDRPPDEPSRKHFDEYRALLVMQALKDADADNRGGPF